MVKPIHTPVPEEHDPTSELEALNYQNLYVMAALQNSWIQSQFQHSIDFLIDNVPWNRHGKDFQGTVLDYGCGSGKLILDHWYPLLCKISFSPILGIDKSPVMINYAKIMFGTNPQFDCCTLEEVAENPFILKDDSFRLIISCFVVAYVPKENLKSHFNNMRKKLTPTGHFVIILAFAEAETIRNKSPIQLFSMNKWADPRNPKTFGVAEWANVFPTNKTECLELIKKPLEDANFNLVKLKYDAHEFSKDFNNIFELEEFLQLTDSSIARTPSLLKSELAIDKKFIQQQCIATYNGEDVRGPITIRWKFFTVMIRKNQR